MSKFIFKLITIGLVIGFIVSALTMFFGVMIYFVLTSIEVFVFNYFLNYVAWVSLVLGISSSLAWYIYLMIIARQFFLNIVERFTPKKEASK